MDGREVVVTTLLEAVDLLKAHPYKLISPMAMSNLPGILVHEWPP